MPSISEEEYSPQGIALIQRILDWNFFKHLVFQLTFKPSDLESLPFELLTFKTCLQTTPNLVAASLFRRNPSATLLTWASPFLTRPQASSSQMSAPRALGQAFPPSIVLPANVSRTPPPSPKRAPPSSPTKRRKFLKESEDNAGKLSIEQYIYRTDPYRSTSVALPYPTPLLLEFEDEPMIQRLQNDRELRELIADTLGRHNIEPQSISVRKQSKPGYPAGGEKLVSVVQVGIDVRDDSPTDAWSPARRDVKALLIERGFGDLEVELIDPQRFYLPSLFPVSPRDPAVAVYEANRTEILEIVKDALADAWTSVSLFMVGRSSMSTQHAIVIMVRPLTEHDWLLLRWRIENLVNTQGAFQAKITVEFMPGYWGYLPPPRSPRPEEETGGKSFVEDFSSDPIMGTSIGVLGERGGGTLGGFFQLECHGRKHKGFLTNSHVVQPAGNTPEAVQKEYHHYGCHYKAPRDHPARSQVRYFAEKDVKATRFAAERRLSMMVKEVERQEHEIGERRMLGKPVDNLLLAKSQNEADQRRLQAMVVVLASMPRYLGNVLCASGRAVTNSHQILDWAFVETPAHIQSQVDAGRCNLLPRTNAPGLYGNGPEEYNCSPPYNPVEPEFPIQGFSKVQKGQWYFKIGRTTGITTGVCNGTQTTFRLKDDQVHVLHDKAGIVERTVKLDKDTVNELVILNAKLDHRSVSQQQTFCRSGDAGSLLIDARGYVAGLVFGSMTGLCGPIDHEIQYAEAGIVTDIRNVLTSLAARTTKRHNNGQPIGAPGTLSVA